MKDTMIVGLIFLGMIVGMALGDVALVTGASLGIALTIYAGFGSLWVLVAGVFLMIRAASTATPHTEQMTAQHIS